MVVWTIFSVASLDIGRSDLWKIYQLLCQGQDQSEHDSVWPKRMDANQNAILVWVRHISALLLSLGFFLLNSVLVIYIFLENHPFSKAFKIYYIVLEFCTNFFLKLIFQVGTIFASLCPLHSGSLLSKPLGNINESCSSWNTLMFGGWWFYKETSSDSVPFVFDY